MRRMIQVFIVEGHNPRFDVVVRVGDQSHTEDCVDFESAWVVAERAVRNLRAVQIAAAFARRAEVLADMEAMQTVGDSPHG